MRSSLEDRLALLEQTKYSQQAGEAKEVEMAGNDGERGGGGGGEQRQRQGSSELLHSSLPLLRNIEPLASLVHAIATDK